MHVDAQRLLASWVFHVPVTLPAHLAARVRQEDDVMHPPPVLLAKKNGHGAIADEDGREGHCVVAVVDGEKDVGDDVVELQENVEHVHARAVAPAGRAPRQ